MVLVNVAMVSVAMVSVAMVSVAMVSMAMVKMVVAKIVIVKIVSSWVRTYLACSISNFFSHALFSLSISFFSL